MSKSYIKTFKKIRLKWKVIRLAEAILLAAIFTIPVIMVAELFSLQAPAKWLLAVVFFLVFLFVLAFKKGVFRVQVSDVSRHLNLHYEQVENSAEVMLKDDGELSPVERIQKQRIERRVLEVVPQIKISNKIIPHLVTFAAAVSLFIYLPIRPGFNNLAERQPSAAAPSETVAARVEKPILPSEIKAARVSIYPPAYTKLPAKHASELALTVPENAAVTWDITFSDSVAKAFLVFDNGDSLALQKKKSTYSTKTNLKKDGFYFISWYNDEDTLQSPFFPINVQPDQPPVIEIKNPAQYLDVPIGNNNAVELEVQANDDHGLSAAYIVATVSRGSGEAVKFREQKLYFDHKITGNTKKIELKKTIDLQALGMAPGDELYYYVVVADNKIPVENISRTDTYFINIPDTAQNEITIGAGLGVDQMPEYFRSQRQIIIDTEKIISEAPEIAKREYQERLNQLGIDQKLLRLRYGQFLGEEFESGINPEMESLVQEQNKRHEHEHEHDHEHGDHQHDHRHEEDNNGQEPALLESYMHIHDYQGEATFFDEAIKAQLKAALAQMWEAELRLRTYRPKAALPFEYKALELIKDVQQKSRVYVERIGFEPPVLKPVENRLTGDLDEVHSQKLQKQMKAEEPYPEMRAALVMIEGVIQRNSGSITYDKNLMNRAGQELASLAVAEPGRYLKPLASFGILTNENISDSEKRWHLIIVQKALHQALPVPEITPYKKDEAKDNIDRLFRIELSRQKKL